MAELFKINANFGELDGLISALKVRVPKQIGLVFRGTLNDAAFAVSNMAKKRVLPSMFILRNAWVQSSVFVDKIPKQITRPALMQSEVGAMKRWKRNRGKPFLGLKIQQFGQRISDPTISTLFSRGGNFSNRVRPTERFNRLGKLETADKYPGSNEKATIRMLRDLDARNFKGGILIRKHRKIKTGIYKFKQGKFKLRSGKRARNIRMIKSLSETSVKIPKRPWLTVSATKAINKGVYLRMVRRNVERFLTIGKRAR